MHDTLEYFKHDSVHRRFHHDELTFRAIYADSEQFVLPLSHDEVVHGKGSLTARMPGDDWQQRANLRLLFGYQHGVPGKKLLFMGADFGAHDEWDHEQSLPWHLLQYDDHQGISRWVRQLNHIHREAPGLHQLDRDGRGFEWVDCSDRDSSVLSWLRIGHDRDDPVLIVANFTPVPRDGFRVGVPHGGHWDLLANSDDGEYGGSGYPIAPLIEADAEGAHGRPFALEFGLPPLGIVFLRRARASRAPREVPS